MENSSKEGFMISKKKEDQVSDLRVTLNFGNSEVGGGI